MLFIQISFTALLLFVANVSSAPLHEPAVRGYMHADHTALPNGRTPVSVHWICTSSLGIYVTTSFI